MKLKKFLSAALAIVMVATLTLATPVQAEAASGNLYGSAKKDKSVVTLTDDDWQSGSVAYSQQLDTKKGFTVSFKYQSTKRDDSYYTADGIVAMFTTEKISEALKTGEWLGLKESSDTYAVEFDSYRNSADANNHHVAIIQRRADNHVASVDSDKVADGKWHNVKIDVKSKKITVYLDDEKILTGKVSMPKTVYFTLTGTTGAYSCIQKVKSVSIKVEKSKLSTPSVTVKSTKSKKATVSWKKVSNADKYNVYRATSKKGKLTKIATTSKTSYTDKKVKKGKTYYYSVVAVDKDKEYLDSAASARKKVKVKK